MDASVALALLISLAAWALAIAASVAIVLAQLLFTLGWPSWPPAPAVAMGGTSRGSSAW